MRGVDNSVEAYTVLSAILGVIPHGPAPPIIHHSDWVLLGSIPWDWIILYLLDTVLVCVAIDRSYVSIVRYRHVQRLSLFWPLFLSLASIGLAAILLDTKRYWVDIPQEILAMGLLVLIFLGVRFSWFS